ncbi:MAG TPA: M56 family metallopeptidase [Pirellulales bacterium]|nr:M56 family metallopeptidase [Pirellulales bacterium]
MGISLAWTALQVTLFCLAGAGAYLLARRRYLTCGASLLCGVLVVTVGLAALSFSPWPRWWTPAGARPTAQISLKTAAATTLREEPSGTLRASAGAKAEAAPETGASGVQRAVFNFLSAIWGDVHNQLADASRAERSDARWHWPAGVAAVILSATAVGLARMLFGAIALARLLRDTQRVDDPSLAGLLAQLRTQLRCPRPIELREMAAASAGSSPAVVGWRRPVILLPADWHLWSEDVRRAVLAHEAAHVAHGDFLMWLAAQSGVILNFYNPLVHWLARRLRLKQELAADARGAALAGGAKAYATVLAKLALAQDDSRPLWAGRPFFPTRGTLMRRIEMLQNQPFVTDRSPSRVWPTALLTALALVGLSVSGLRGPTAAVRADDLPSGKDSSESAPPATHEVRFPKFDDAYLPEDAIAVLSVKPLKVANSAVVVSPALLHFPMSFNLGWSTADNGVDEVRDIVFSPAPSEASSAKPHESTEPALVEIYRMHKPYERDKVRVRIFGEAPDGVTETTCHGYSCFRARSEDSGLLVDYLLVDDRTIVIVRDRDLPRVLEADPESHPSWYGEWRKVADSPLAVGFDPEAIDALVAPAKDSAEEAFFSVLKNTTHVFGRVDSTTEGLLVSGKVLCKSSEAAVAATQAAKATLALAQMAIPQLLQPSDMPKEYQPINVSGPLMEALANLKVNVNGARVDVEGKLGAAFVAEIAQATQALVDRQTNEYKAREKEDEQAHIAKLGRLAAAMNAYHAEHGHYPSAAVVGPDGKTLHSWRVELLPYLGEQKLFDEYRLDEPWDSEHNKPLVEKIPSIYSTSLWSQKGDADYFVVTGKGTLFDAAAPARRESVADAPGETILVLQSLQRIPWTKPVDIETSADHDAVRPFRGHGKGFYAAFADGTVKFVSKATDATSVRAMFTKAGGDEVKLR